jgi:hypothetical protein
MDDVNAKLDEAAFYIETQPNARQSHRLIPIYSQVTLIWKCYDEVLSQAPAGA